MIKRWLTRYGLHYPRSLVYMLQSCEYNVLEYLAWHARLKDFSSVEKRKRFEKTPKGLLMLFFAWFIVFLPPTLLLFTYQKEMTSLWIIALLGTVIFLPYFLAYLIILPLLFLKYVIEPPVNYFIISSAKKELKKNKALKIGVVGSFGKTTMREILKTVLSEGKKVAVPPYNYNTPLGISRFIKTLEGDEDIIIFELGEYYVGDIRKLCEFVEPDIGFITGINEAHLEKFKTLEETEKIMHEFTDYLKEKKLYLNGESEIVLKNARPSDIIYSKERVGEWMIDNKKTNLEGVSFVMSNKKETIELNSHLLGLHQIGPLAGAVYISLSLGISLEQIKSGVSKTKPFNHRLDPREKDGVVVIDDSYNGNPDGVKVAIEFLSSLKNCRRFYVTPGLVEMGERKKTIHQEIGRRLAEAGIEKIILIKNSVTPYIKEGLEEGDYKGEVIFFEDALKAFEAIPLLTVKGDVVLLQNDWPDQYQ